MAIRIEDLQRMDLGIMGEHNATIIQIDCSGWIDQYPNGVISLWHKRKGDADLGATGASYDSGTKRLTWSVTDTDTYYAGDGMAEIRLTDGSVVKKKKKALTLVRPAVVNENGDTLSSNMQAYINEMERIKSQLGSEAEAWATGKRNGEDVSSDDETYHNNAAYYFGQLAAAAQGYIDAIQAAGAAAEALIPEDLSFYASVSSLADRFANYGVFEADADAEDWYTLKLEEPEEEEEEEET